MKLKSKDFRMALDKVAHLATGRISLPILNTVKLSANGSFDVVATDLDCFARARCESQGVLDSICASPRLLTGLLSSDEIEMEFNGKSLLVKGSGNAQLYTSDALEFPEWPSDPKAKSLGVNCNDLADAIEAVAWTADTKQEARPLCGAIHIQCSAKSITAQATDGASLSYFHRPAIAADCEVMIGSEHSKTLAEALRQDGAIVTVMDSWVCVTSDNFSACVRRMEGNYFATDKIVNSKRTLIGMVDAKALKAILSTIASLGVAQDWDCRTSLNFTGKTLEIEFIGKANSFTTQMPFKCKNPISLMINATWLKQTLDNTDGDELKMSVAEAHALVFESGDVTNFLQQLVTK